MDVGKDVGGASRPIRLRRSSSWPPKAASVDSSLLPTVAKVDSPSQANIIGVLTAIGKRLGTPQTPPFPKLPPRTQLNQTQTETEAPPPAACCVSFLTSLLFPEVVVPEFTEPQSFVRRLFQRHQPNQTPPELVRCITPEQKEYLVHLEKKRTILYQDEAEIDQRSDQIEMSHVTVLSLYIAVIAGGAFVGGSLKDPRQMFILFGILAAAFVVGTCVPTVTVYLSLRRLWWRRFDLWNRKRILLQQIEGFSSQIEDFHGIQSTPTYSIVTLAFAKTRLNELKSSLGESRPPYLPHNWFVGLQFLACSICLGVMVYWTYFVSRGKLDHFLFGTLPEHGYSHAASE